VALGELPLPVLLSRAYLRTRVPRVSMGRVPRAGDHDEGRGRVMGEALRAVPRDDERGVL